MLFNPCAHRKLLCIPLSLALLQSGCASNVSRGGSASSGGYGGYGGQATSMTQQERSLRQQSAQLDATSSIQGCVAGAALGALVGMLAGGRNRSQNVAVGAAIGCGVGVGANAYVQSKRSSYQSEEERMGAIIADVRADNRKLSSLITTTKSVTNADRRKLQEVDKAYRKKAVSRDQARRELASVKANRDQIQRTVNALKKKENDWIEVAELERRSGSNTAKLDREIAKLKSQVSSLEREVALMDQQIRVSPAAG